jgi:DNA-directed RNA polymerase specialized sigma24 family protein
VSHLLTPEEEYSQAEIQKAIEKTLKNLPWRYAKILKLKYIDGLTVKEIALRFTETVKQSEATLFRARKAFVGVYQQWQNGNNYLLRRRHTGSWRQKWLSKPNFRPKI